MIFDLSISELLIISLFFITAINCVTTYFCCTKSLKILEKDKSLSKAINNLRIFDQYLLSKMNIIIALVYFVLSYLFIDEILNTDFIFFLSCILSFFLTLLTTFISRLCYCYTCNVLLETKLNEIECLVLNFKSLLIIYIPFIVISLVAPVIYSMDIGNTYKHVLAIVSLAAIIIVLVLLTPKIMIMNYSAKPIEKNTMLRYKLESLLEKHDIKNYKLYYLDSSRSKESNAMVSGVRTYHLFVSTCLIEELTLPELETVITHEIGHIKCNHLLKMMVGKVFIVFALLLLIVSPYLLGLSFINKGLFYFSVVICMVIGLIISVSVERKYELEADVYAACYNDPELFASALRKISDYEVEDDDKSKMDELFQSHPDIKERIEKIKKGE